MRRTLFGVAVSAALVLAGCVSGDPDVSPGPSAESDRATGSVATALPNYLHATIGEPESLDPAYNYETAGGTILQHVYETLVFYAGPSAVSLEPRLAAGMPDVSEDGLQYTFNLRNGVTFHNGDTLDAEDVKFSLDRIILMNDPHSPAWIYGSIAGADAYMQSEGTAKDRKAYLDQGGVAVVDPMTVRFTLDYPDPAFLYRLAYTGASVVSKEGVCAESPPGFVDCLPPPGETRHEWMDTHEVGSGPFELESWEAGQQIVLKRFDGYWGEKPALGRVLIKKVEDFNTRLLMLRSGEADSAYVPVDHAADVEGLPGVVIEENPSWSVSFIGFNQAWCGGAESETYATCAGDHADAAPKGADGEVDPDFFADPNMRRAWSLAFDYDTYHEEILEGHGKMLNGALPEGIFGYDPTIPRPIQNVEAARVALAASDHPDGFSVSVYYNSGNTVREKTSQLLKQNVEALAPGKIHVNVVGLDWSTGYLPKLRVNAVPVFYMGWAPDYAFPDNYVVSFAHSEKGTFSKRMGYRNPALDALLDTLLRETDKTELQDGYGRAVRALNDDNAFIWLSQASDYHVHRDWVQGYYFNPMYAGNPGIGDYTAITKDR